MNYLKLYRTGRFASKIAQAKELLSPCNLCPRECGARRLEGERGVCGAGQQAEISGSGPHFGEEPPLVGTGGSGTIFFAFCSLQCVFCQNYEISRGKNKYEITAEDLAQKMYSLQQRGCENINLVTPTHYVPQILEALEIACGLGLNIPLVYNCSGYERLETLRMLEGIVDIYMPDIKYADAQIALKYSRIADYPRIAQAALQEMHRQVGDLTLNQEGIAMRGLLIRHLVLPAGVAGTSELMRFIAQKVSPTSWINIMDQYTPTYLADRYPEISRRISKQEFWKAINAALQASPLFHFL